MLLVAIAAWTWFTPSLERAVTFQLGWMLEILLRNLCIVLAVAGGLHLFLFTFRKQGDTWDSSTSRPVKPSRGPSASTSKPSRSGTNPGRCT